MTHGYRRLIKLRTRSRLVAQSLLALLISSAEKLRIRFDDDSDGLAAALSVRKTWTFAFPCGGTVPRPSFTRGDTGWGHYTSGEGGFGSRL
jgi:hypothetical protein